MTLFRLTDCERDEWLRCADCIQDRNPQAAERLRHYAFDGRDVPVAEFTRLVHIYRAWLVFNEINH